MQALMLLRLPSLTTGWCFGAVEKFRVIHEQ